MIAVRKMAHRRFDNKINIKNQEGEATIYLYSDIGGWFGIDHQEFIKEFNDIKAGTIHLRVDSGGGDIFAARAIKTAIMQHKSKVVAHIDGLAASAASFLVMGADEIEIVDGGFMMIHNALSFIDVFGYFNIQAIEKLIEEFGKEKSLHESLNKSIAKDYAKKTGGDIDEFLGYMEDETWFEAEEALEKGLVDRIYDGETKEGKYDLSMYNNVPDRLKMRSNTNMDINQRDLEKNLRDVGYSKNQAKDIVAKVFRNGRDAQSEPDNQDGRDAQSDTGTEPQNDNTDTLVDDVVDLLTRAKNLTKKG